MLIILLQTLTTQGYLVQNNSMFSPFVYPLSPNIPPPQNPQYHMQYNNSSPRDTNFKKKDNTKTQSSQEKKSAKSSLIENNSSTTKSDSASGRTPNLFIPSQVCIILRVSSIYLGLTKISHSRCHSRRERL